MRNQRLTQGTGVGTTQTAPPGLHRRGARDLSRGGTSSAQHMETRAKLLQSVVSKASWYGSAAGGTATHFDSMMVDAGERGAGWHLHLLPY